MAAAMSAPPLEDALNFTSNLDHPHPHHQNHNNNNNNNNIPPNHPSMAGDNDDDDDKLPYTVERPRAVASTERNGSNSTSSPHNNNTTSSSDMLPPPARKMSRLGLSSKKKSKLAVTTPSQEDLHSRWAEMQDPSSVINSNSFKEEQEQEQQQQRPRSNPMSIAEGDEGEGADNKDHKKGEQQPQEEEEKVPPYAQPTPRPLYYHTVVRDFAYPSDHDLHQGSLSSHTPDEDDDFPSDDQDYLSDWGTGSSSMMDQPGPHRRVSDSGESSTYNTGIGRGERGGGGGAGGPQWTHGPWGGDGGMEEDMEPLPSTSFRNDHSQESMSSSYHAHLSSSHNNNHTSTSTSKKKQHRKSRSFADTSSYERGRRRGESNASKRGSFHAGNDGGGGGHSDPAGRDALRASRGMEPAEGFVDDDMYALSLSSTSHPQQSSSSSSSAGGGGPGGGSGGGGSASSRSGGHRTRRDSHIATLPSRTFHEAQRPLSDANTSPSHPPHPQQRTNTTATTISDLPLDLEEDVLQHHNTITSPQRESLGPEDETLFAGPSLVLYDFEPENCNELRIREREIIMVSYRHGLGWLVAENGNGEKGLVPEEYVRLLSEMEAWDGGWG